MWRWGPPCFCSLWVGPLSDRPKHSDGDAPPTTNPYQQQNIKQTTKTWTLSSPKSPTLLIPIPIPEDLEMPHQNPDINLETAEMYKVTVPRTPPRCVTK
ncbi:hypothetical protein OPV22_001222 [Ensete ventricosum]|uniref:Uncharacterized protein n=1 Tax=Ensete ventricosum TaxID=4639 RepID=A0AAV8RUF3_ENSVE|nr:hypothetical protein OPV22_001222 [Ensete ventricosum]